MIHALTMPADKYSVTIGDDRFGLYESYWDDQALFCLLSRTCSAFFMYEKDSPIAEHDRVTEIDVISLYADTLDQSIDGVTVRSWLELTDPRAWAELMRTTDTSHLSMIKLFMNAKFKPVDALWTSTYIRALQYEKYFRGRISKEGNKIEAVFSSRLSAEEDSFLEEVKTELFRVFKEVVNGK